MTCAGILDEPWPIPSSLGRPLSRMQSNENRSGTPSVVRMSVGRFQTLPNLLLPRSRRSAGMILARLAVAKSSRSAASSEDLSGTFYWPYRKTALRTSTINIFQIQALLVTLTFYTTKTLTRRGIVAGVASVALIRRVCASTTDVDIVVVGAGAAGLAAAKQIKASGQSVIVLEARPRIGGRAFTDTSLGAPFDAGAQYIHWAERNPMKRIADALGVPLQDDDTGSGRFLILKNGRPLSEDERMRRSAAFGTMWRLITPPDAGDASFADAVRGAPEGVADTAAGITRMALGEEPERVSLRDYDQLWAGDDYVVLSGYGALVARFGADVPVSLETPATHI